MLATLLLSRGTPMIVAGDEFGRTQNGNNNAYCQDNEISWLNWNIEEKGRNLIKFVSDINALRRRLPILHRSRFPDCRMERGTRRQGRGLAEDDRRGDGSGGVG